MESQKIAVVMGGEGKVSDTPLEGSGKHLYTKQQWSNIFNKVELGGKGEYKIANILRICLGIINDWLPLLNKAMPFSHAPFPFS